MRLCDRLCGTWNRPVRVGGCSQGGAGILARSNRPLVSHRQLQSPVLETGGSRERSWSSFMLLMPCCLSNGPPSVPALTVTLTAAAGRVWVGIDQVHTSPVPAFSTSCPLDSSSPRRRCRLASPRCHARHVAYTTHACRQGTEARLQPRPATHRLLPLLRPPAGHLHGRRLLQ